MNVLCGGEAKCREYVGYVSPYVAICGLALAVGTTSCKSSARKANDDRRANDSVGVPELETPDEYAAARARLVAESIVGYGISDPLVIEAIGTVRRHELVPADLRWGAYLDRALPIGSGQTISQPYIVALMTESAELTRQSRVLEIGTGSGYQAAVLAEIAAEVYTIEIVSELGSKAKAALDRLGYDNIEYRIGDGYKGWPDKAPFDAIVVTAAPDHVPEPLKQQLAVGAKLVIPVGTSRQELLVITREPDGFSEQRVAAVLFVPMTGEAQATQ